MISIPHKAKQFLLVLVKLLIVTGALYYIVNQLQGEKVIDWNVVSKFLSLKSIIILVIFSTINWFLEIYKWQNLVSSFKKITFLESAQQSLGSLTASIFTPNRIGEYGAKALFFEKKKVKKIIFLNFIGNSSQMAITCLFGVLGIILQGDKIKFQVSILILLGLVITIILLLAKDIEFYGFSIQKLINKFRKLPNEIINTNWNISFLRYLMFSHQFYFLLIIFHCDIDYITAISTISLMYLIASIIPSIHLLDVTVKGSVAIYLFGTYGIESWKIITITTVMWLFNLVIPVLIGSYFVLRYKPVKL